MTTPVFAAQPYAGIATFGRAPLATDATGYDVSILGIPYDGSVSYRSGTRFGPRAIREQSMLLWGYNNSQRVAPFKQLRIADLGDADVVPPDIRATHQEIEKKATAIVESGSLLVSIGGDHSISLPLLRAHAKKHGPMAVVHFDAHPDTWDSEYPGQPFSHGTPFRRAMEESLIDPAAYVQIGIRGPTNGPEDYEDALKLGARMITFDEFHQVGLDAVLKEIHCRVGNRATYVTLDIDAIDPAFAPGTGTPEVGGFTSYEMLRLIRGLHGLNLKGFDLVEVSPPFDSAGITAILGVNLIFEFLSLIAKNRATPS
ncbi:agmatinase [Schlesneria paludicola]|uniref:agmatinase n=1 Tax=Schlesneria paludicola TaxID=360056 RepID=UPI00029A7782|nr:agmatinase [Schlesneria paludicola]